ncbi:hypothetical protein [Dactylosporangium sp. CA-139066]|uniref:hypothetical protein n=1 Tax=Dactylosporangium sp. CA-139066 TaxID=3239930 RepID=UPI003D8C2496
MSDRLEMLVRQAQEARARAAEPDLEGIRRALPILARQRARRRRAGFAAAAAVVVLACVSALLAAGPPRDDRPAGRHPVSPAPSVSDESAADGVVVMPYTIDQPPAGYRERLRTVEDAPGGAAVTRVYTSRTIGAKAQIPPETPRLTLTVRPGADLPDGDETGAGPDSAAGTYAEDNDSARLAWAGDPEHVVVLEAVGMGVRKADLVQYSRQVRHAPATFDKPLTLGWRPGEHPVMSYAFGGDDPATWAASVTADAFVEGRGTLTAALQPFGNPPAGGTPVDVGGQHGVLVEGDGQQMIVARWPDSSYDLVVTFRYDGNKPLPRPQLIAAAVAVHRNAQVSTEWLAH